MGCMESLTRANQPNERYYADATDCFHTSTLKQNVDVKYGTRSGEFVGGLNFDIPMGSDAGAFRLCMEHKGHPVEKVQLNADDYQRISADCMDEAQASSTPNETYASCVQRGTITVEPILNRK